jgi:hypothetical protein
VFDGRAEVARHERLMSKGGVRLELDHYLEVLGRKPGALPGSTALEQARAFGAFTPVHDAWWAAARKAHGDADGTRALIEVLLLHPHMPRDLVVAGLAAALRAGAFTADAVALEARTIADRAGSASLAGHDDGRDWLQEPAGEAASSIASRPVASLTERRLRASQLPSDTRPLPSVAQYDDLLPRRRARP